ncbi:ABC transporter permease [Fodinicola acaciae]|uniref:ABC transporter permease n=1 Tax=Fodinicola acaciae TaxID=2681555 RepID=UPI0013D5DA6A|nr:ABC transporter permease [Fodinicola acaciae]
MNATVLSARSGLSRGVIEVRNSLSNWQDIFGAVFPNVILLVVMLFMRGANVPGLKFSLGATVLPSVIGMGIAFGGILTLASQLMVDREDGTLLRAKATPNGMMGYLVGKIVYAACFTLVGVLLQLVPGLLLFDGVGFNGVGGVLTLIVVIALGLVATLPLGAILGSLFSNPRNMGMVMFPIMGLVGISGIFYPLTQLPVWLQWIGQMFPIYWLGLGTRSAMLPEQLMAVEVGHSWRGWETIVVLLVWAVASLVVAPAVLRRMARRESGSSVAERREKAMQRVG